MEYREMRMQTGTERPSLLGFGCMRFPVTAEGTIDEAQAEAMIDRAIKAGVNYIAVSYTHLACGAGFGICSRGTGSRG